MSAKEGRNDYPCPICGSNAAAKSEDRELSYGTYAVPVRDEFMQCEQCHERFYLPGQMEEVDRKAGEYAKRVMQVFLPWQITELRELLQLNRVEFERLLGTGPKTDIRWEQGRVTPNAVVNALLFLLEAIPDNVRLLAGWRGVSVRKEAIIEPSAPAQHIKSRLPMTLQPSHDDVIPMQPYLERRLAAQLNVRVAPIPYTEGTG